MWLIVFEIWAAKVKKDFATVDLLPLITGSNIDPEWT